MDPKLKAEIHQLLNDLCQHKMSPEAKAYISAALDGRVTEAAKVYHRMEIEGYHTQLTYILSNTATMRNTQAQAIRKALRIIHRTRMGYGENHN